MATLPITSVMGKKKQKTKIIYIRMNPELYKLCEDSAKKGFRSTSAEINRRIMLSFESEGKKVDSYLDA